MMDRAAKFPQFCLSEKVFISSSLLKEHSLNTEFKNWWTFSFQHFKYFIPPAWFLRGSHCNCHACHYRCRANPSPGLVSRLSLPFQFEYHIPKYTHLFVCLFPCLLFPKFSGLEVRCLPFILENSVMIISNIDPFLFFLFPLSDLPSTSMFPLLKLCQSSQMFCSSPSLHYL